MEAPNNFGSQKSIFWTNYIIGVFGPKTKRDYFSNILLYTKPKNEKN